MKVYERKLRIPPDTGFTDDMACRELVHHLIANIPIDELKIAFRYSNHKVDFPPGEIQHEIQIYL